MKYLFVTLLLPLCTQIAVSQEDEKIEELYFEGNEYLLSEEHIEALPSFLELYKIAPSANFQYKLGECYLNIEGKKDKAIFYLEQAVLSSSSKYDAASPYEKHTPFRSWYLLGKAYRINDEPDKAINALKILLDSLNGEDPEIVEQIEWEIEVNETAKLFLESPISFHKENLGVNINNQFSNYNPVVTADGNTIFYMDALKFYDAVMTSEKDSTGWTKGDNITSKLRSDGDFNLTHASLKGDKLLFYFYDIFSKGDIYQSVKKNDKWGRLEKLNENINTNYHETHASISGDGKTLYFTSNRPGGFGALDIYKSELDEDGEWGPAKNLGEVINTLKNENTPFITADGKTLYFTSEYHYNMGGYDIFKSENFSGQSWNKPKNLGYPINTTDNDLFFFPLNQGETAYRAFYSNSEGFGQSDIYKVTKMTEPLLRKFVLSGEVKSDDERIDDDQVLVSIESMGKIIAEPTVKDGRFDYRVTAGEYDVSVQANNFNKATIEITLHDEQDMLTIPLEFLLPRIEGPISVVEKDTIALQNIYFTFDKFNLSAENQNFLTRIADDVKKYDLELIIEGYTDSRGPEIYNVYLSQMRAKKVKEYLESSGISGDNLQIEAYGEKNPVAKNETEEGKDLPAGRKFNRRVEIKIKESPDNVIVIRQTNIPEHLLK